MKPYQLFFGLFVVSIAALMAIHAIGKDDEKDQPQQEYVATVTTVKDGDTLVLKIEQPEFDLTFERAVRIYGINSHEIHSSSAKEKELGLADKAYAEKICPVGTTVKVRSFKAGRPNEKFGRWLVVVTLPNGKDFAKEMLKAGHAEEYYGGKREQVKDE